MIDYAARVIAIIVIFVAGYAALSKIDPLGGKDYSGVPKKAKIKIAAVLLIIFAILLFLNSN